MLSLSEKNPNMITLLPHVLYSSHTKRYAGELRAFHSTLISVLLRISTAICTAIFAPVQFHKNHNLIKELPKVKYEEEGKSGFNFLSQSSVWTIMAFTCWDNTTNTTASRNEQCWPTVCTIAAVQIARPFWPDLSNVNTERSLPLLVDSHSFPLGLKGYRGAGQ